MIYMNGSDLESENKIASMDLMELCKAKIPENTTVLVETGGTKKWHLKEVNEEKNQIFEIKNGKLNLLRTMNKRSMGDRDTLSDFVEYSINYKKSDENILVFWNHGGGAIVGFGKDENFKSDALVLNEIKGGLKTAYEETGKKLDLIAFDACLMSSLETAYAVKDYAKYMVASEELVMGYGFDYKKIMESMGLGSIENIGKFFVNSYYNESFYKGKRDIVTMSLIDLDGINKVYNEFNKYLMKKNIKYDISGKYKNVSKPISFGGRTREEGYSNMVDFMSLIKNIFNEEEITSLSKALKDTVVHIKNGYINKDACGLSIFFPIDYNKKSLYELKLYNNLSEGNNYYKFLNKYIKSRSAENLKSFYNIKENKGKNIIYEIKSKGSRLNLPFYLDKIMLSVKKIGTVNSVDIYTAPVLVNDKEASLRFDIDRFTKKINIQGVIMARGELNLSEKKVMDLKVGDKVNAINFEILEDGEIKRIKGDELKVTVDTQLLQM